MAKYYRWRWERGRGRKEGMVRDTTYVVRECVAEDDVTAALPWSLFHNRDLYAGQVLKFHALTRKLESPKNK